MVKVYNDLDNEIKKLMEEKATAFLKRGSISEKIIEKELIYDGKKRTLSVFIVDKLAGFNGIRLICYDKKEKKSFVLGSETIFKRMSKEGADQRIKIIKETFSEKKYLQIELRNSSETIDKLRNENWELSQQLLESKQKEISETDKSIEECWGPENHVKDRNKFDRLNRRKSLLTRELEKNDNSYIRNILIIGEENKGKSTLANVLSRSDSNFFLESTSSNRPNNSSIKHKIFEEGWKKYRVIDTVGVKPTEKFKIPQNCNSGEYCTPQGLAQFIEMISNNGINQIFLVINPLPDKRWIEFYKLLNSFIFDKDIIEYTTIVRTHFDNFNDEERCENERNNIRGKIENLLGKEFENVTNFDERIIFIDNPSITSINENERENNRRKRDSSREILMKRLMNCNEVYYPKNLRKLNEFLSNKNYSEGIEELSKKLFAYYSRTDQEEKIIKQSNEFTSAENTKNALATTTAAIQLIIAIITVTSKFAACTIM